ncbi:MAG: YegS/Rv2252/BmrU family lipid kinase [Nannocystaceae bacterium]
MRASLIHHPGGGSASDDDFERARAHLAERLDLRACAVGDGESTADVARREVDDGSRLLIASGGDGTVSAVASALVDRTDLALGILPQGTSNSISIHLGIPRALDDACAVILGGHERVIDTAVANGRPMVMMATLGIHAEAITEADRELKQRIGALAYVLEEVRRLFDDSLFEAWVESGGQRFRCETSALTIANVARATALFAQGAPELIDDDGLLDVTLVAIDGVAEAVATSLHLAARALSGLPASRPNVAHFRAREIRIETAAPKRVMIDGEDAGETPLVVTARPRSLRVRVPAPA